MLSIVTRGQLRLEWQTAGPLHRQAFHLNDPNALCVTLELHVCLKRFVLSFWKSCIFVHMGVCRVCVCVCVCLVPVFHRPKWSKRTKLSWNNECTAMRWWEEMKCRVLYGNVGYYHVFHHMSYHFTATRCALRHITASDVFRCCFFFIFIFL